MFKKLNLTLPNMVVFFNCCIFNTFLFLYTIYYTIMCGWVLIIAIFSLYDFYYFIFISILNYLYACVLF